MFHSLYLILTSPEARLIYKVVYQTSFFWLPIFLGFLFYDIWIVYRRAQFLASKTFMLLEIKVPKDMFKSPLSMELFMNSLWQTGGEGTWVDRLYKGQTRPTFSLEIVAQDGQIHFYIWTRKNFKTLIEANLYSQFPGIEVYEIEDYVLPVSHNPEKQGLWGCEFGLTKADPYPIKTYVDYGMDKDPKEEYKIDPMTPLIEFMGSLGRGHRLWIQIVIRAHKLEEDIDPKTGKKVDLKWKHATEKIIDDLLKKTKNEKGEDGKEKFGRLPTRGETDVVAALERSISKIAFDTGIRALYTAPNEEFSADNIAGITGGFRNYNSNNLNGFKVVDSTSFDFPWEDYNNIRLNKKKRKILHSYKNRGYFYNEFKTKTFVLNTEELATIFHFPGGVSNTPAFSRINSKKSEAPANLPI